MRPSVCLHLVACVWTMVMRVQGETTATPSDCVDGACVCEWLGGELHVNCTKPGTLTSLPDMGDSRSNVTEL